MAEGVPGTDLPPATDRLLRPALQLAFDVARIGARSRPPIEAPRAVRPFLHFTGRLPDAALAAVRRALDDDAAFRARVAGLADEDELGRAGWLFVVRPAGWDGDLAALIEEAVATARVAQEERDERSARRRLAHAEHAADRAETAAARHRAELGEANAELAAERRARRSAQDEAAQLTRRAGSLEGERDSARRKAAASSAEVERLRAELAAAQAEAGRLRAAVTATQMEIETQIPKATGSDIGTTTAGASDERPTVQATPTAAGDAGGGAPGLSGPDLGAVASAVAAAAAAAATLGRALADASTALAPATPDAGQHRGVVDDERRPVGSPSASRPGRAPLPRRRPAALPPAVLDDTAAAAAHLVRVPRALVLVDGYNAAKALWPDVAPLELRERLVDALSELVARTGVAVHVVYDGADLGVPSIRPADGRGVRTSFSPADVEADDVILDLVDAEPADRPIVVASSDRRVQDGARHRGANVISSAQLAAVLGRA